MFCLATLSQGRAQEYLHTQRWSIVFVVFKRLVAIRSVSSVLSCKLVFPPYHSILFKKKKKTEDELKIPEPNSALL